MKKRTTQKTIKLTVLFYTVVVAGVLLTANACRKSTSPINTPTSGARPEDNSLFDRLTRPMTIADMRPTEDGQATEVRFLESEKIYVIDNKSSEIENLKNAFKVNEPLRVTLNTGTGIEKTERLQASEIANYNSNRGPVQLMTGASKTFNVNLNKDIDNAAPIELPNNTSKLTSIIPDMATAQMIFDYFMQQTCNLPGPYGIDYCISFQYTEDGCYARAHKMRWLLENKYHYSCNKVFSFANSGSDALAVRANRWGGCCIGWWYHVAPLVTIKTPAGNKSYVMDPAMFDTPVLLSTWLGAQQNKTCSPNGHVSMYSIQPAIYYSPYNYAGTLFDTDPNYASTDTTLVHYSHLKSCP